MNKIGVVIPTHNRKEHLKTVLNCLNKQKTVELKLKIIVVVDGSKDGTIEMLHQEFQSVDIVLGDGNWWFTKSLNQGIHRATNLGCDYILTLNDDCYFNENMVQTLWDANLKQSKKVAIGAITLINSRGKYRVTFSGTKSFIKWRVKLVPYLDNRKEYDLEQLKGIYPTRSLMTRGLMFPIEIGAEINFFDENNFPQYGSDDDFVLRLLKHGFSAFVSWDAKIYDNPLLSSVGRSITRPAFKQFLLSFFNKYSVNSVVKTFKFQQIHGSVLLLPFSMTFYILGTFYAYIWKYRKTNI